MPDIVLAQSSCDAAFCGSIDLSDSERHQCILKPWLRALKVLAPLTQADSNWHCKCLTHSKLEHRQRSKTTPPFCTRRNRLVLRYYIFAVMAANGLVQMNSWSCVTCHVQRHQVVAFGRRTIVMSTRMGRHFSAVRQSSVALMTTLHSQDGMYGKSIMLQRKMVTACIAPGKANCGPKP